MFVVTLLAKGVMSRVFTLCSMFPLLRDLPVMFADSEGFRYYVRVQDLWRFSKPFEPLTSKFLVGNADESDIFLDVGAHIGLYTIRLAQKVSKVIALEPEPKNYTLVETFS
jgi:predicted O-methyltransferase YrrM